MNRRSHSQRGSAIITVLILAAVTAVIASGFLFRSAQEAKLATRSFYQSAALNLAEAGLEEGLQATNSSGLTSANGWTLVSGTTSDYTKTITSDLNLTQGAGSIYVRVDGGATLSPTITAAGVVQIPNQPRLVKQLRIATAKRRLWSNGIVVKGTLTFSGNAQIDSYDSSLGPYNSATNRSDQATVSTTSTALDPVVVGSSAAIYGYVSTGGADPLVGTGGRIYGATTPVGTNVDTSRIRHDFVANLPDATVPTGTAITLGSVVSAVTLPRLGDVAGANGRYLYSTDKIAINSHDTVTIGGPVDLIVTGNISLTGNSGLVITALTTSSLNVYCPGNIELGGSSSINQTNKPSTLTVWSTAPSGSNPTVTISGNADYVGTIYAPNATVNLAGNGTTNGAVIGAVTNVSGSGVFHYDTKLANIQTSLDVSFRLTAWAELSGQPGTGGNFVRDNRSPFASLF